MKEPRGWRQLQKKALAETDPQRLVETIEKLNALLDAHEKKEAEIASTKSSFH